MTDGFEKYFEAKEERKRKDMAKMAMAMVKSVSLDALNISSQGFMVSDNWLQASHRKCLLQCPHSWDGMPIKNIPRQRRHRWRSFA